MSATYFDLQEESLSKSPEFSVSKDGDLSFHGVQLLPLIEKYGAPLKLSYLPSISYQIKKARLMFAEAFKKCDYKGEYVYTYCTKSSHFSFVLDEVLKNKAHIETSSAFDIPIVNKLHQSGKISKDIFIVCNGFKRPEYLLQISKLINRGFKNVIPVLDNESEFDAYERGVKNKYKLGLRIATDEVPNFSFYTSRLGLNPHRILDFYDEKIAKSKLAELKMLHFFINTGIKDHTYYWNELDKSLKLYVALKRRCPSLDSLNIGGGLPFKTHLTFEYDYQNFIDKIISRIQEVCEREQIDAPTIFTEFGSYTVAESGANVYQVLDQKKQNDKELWYMLNNSFMTTLPDTWGLEQRFICLPINKWNKGYRNVFLGGLTCDSMDFYNNEVHNNKIFMPESSAESPLYIGFFNTGAYQEAIAGYGGIKHCLIPSPKHIVVGIDENGNQFDYEFKKEQSAAQMLKILGY